MTDHYAVLKVKEDATEKELRTAFRRMAKKYHPDVNSAQCEWAHRQMKKVLDAYSVLTDDTKRQAYDRHRRHQRNGQRDHYRERLARKDDPASRAELVLYDLLNNNEAAAVINYEAVFARDIGFDVADHLPPRDWMDCKFLLGEQYERRKAHLKALHLYEDIYYSSQAKGHYKHFLSEVGERIRKLCCRELAKSVEPLEAIPYYERALRIRLKRSQRAFLHKKIAECYGELGRLSEAAAALECALAIVPDLKGCQKIRRKLGIEPEEE